MRQFQHRLRTHGVLGTFRIGLRKLSALTSAKAKPAPAAVAPADEILGLQPGDWVEVKSLDEIRSTLDSRGCHRGLDFTEEMLEYCGRRFRVFKRVERICMEGKGGEMRTLKNTVSLEGAICNGGSRGCDRGCMMFWREAWLKRVGSERIP
jgi:hypothetical protein